MKLTKEIVIGAIAVVGIAALINGAGHGSKSTSTANSSEPASSQKAAPAAPKLTEEQQDQRIFDEYNKKIVDMTPTLVNEYRSEAANNTGGVMGLANLSNAKITKLADTMNEGISKMAKVMMTSGGGKQDTYTAYARKLQDVYTAQAGQIQDAYMQSAQ